jgi:hypothetical protein
MLLCNAAEDCRIGAIVQRSVVTFIPGLGCCLIGFNQGFDYGF